MLRYSNKSYFTYISISQSRQISDKVLYIDRGASRKDKYARSIDKIYT